jgi:CubicO group peptidase (beta-lactamase class C family)
MTPDNPDIFPFDRKFSRYNEGHCPGLAVMVIQDGVTKFKQGYGHSNLATKEKINCDTNFRMASVSKQFAAMAVAILEERGKISRNDYISQYLSDVPKYMHKIEVWHLVHHLSGLPDYADELWSSDKSKPLVSNHDVYDYYRKQKNLDFTPGEKHEYSNGGYSLLALVVENAADQLFKDFSRENIFVPAGMENTAIIEYPSNIKNQAISYGEWPFFEDIDFNTGNALQGEDGVYTSLNDMESWLNAIDANRLVSDSTTKRLFSPVQTTKGEIVKYGYGWEWGKYHSMDMLVHGGSWVGFNTIVTKAPEKNMWFVGFSNTDAISSNKAVLAMADHFLGKER